MTRLTIVILAAAVLSLTALAAAHAQEPTGSISGRIVFVGPQPEFVVGSALPYVLILLPGDLAQPFDAIANFSLIHADAEGNFSLTGLVDGDYFISPVEGRLLETSTPAPESVRIISGGVQSTLLAVRVTVANGAAVTGIEIVIRLPEPVPPGPGREVGVGGSDCPLPLSPPAQLSPPSGLSPPNDVPFLCAPATGAGPGRVGDTAVYIAFAVAGLAALLLAGGVALRARGGRRP